MIDSLFDQQDTEVYTTGKTTLSIEISDSDMDRLKRYGLVDEYNRMDYKILMELINES